MKKPMINVVMIAIMVSTCLLLSGCFIMGGDHFLWF